ncbi:Probable ribosome biogenesis protein RLP24 [Linum grandiflorum]
MRLENCWFCSSKIYPGHGIQFVRNDAKKKLPVQVSHSLLSNLFQIFRFCRSKCHKNFKMKRNPRKVKWTKAYRKLHGKDMTKDSTFEFERKRNRPDRYDRNVVKSTLDAIKKIEKIRHDREANHIRNRLKPNKIAIQKAARRELDQSIRLVDAEESIRNKGKVLVTVPDQKQTAAMEE